mmetsp:Transcript_131510/g.327991  ORF Transcript_131510/g.327991 Transcript_131510/m.327991 type:complete len:89 (+) Transcript_131510:101-367(+)
MTAINSSTVGSQAETLPGGRSYPGTWIGNVTGTNSSNVGSQAETFRGGRSYPGTWIGNVTGATPACSHHRSTWTDLLDLIQALRLCRD